MNERQNVHTETKLATKNDIFNALRPILKKYNIKQAAVFGSYVRGDYSAESDVDVVIVLDYNYSLSRAFYNFCDEAENNLGLTIDAITLKSLKESRNHKFRQNVQSELEWFYEI